jgi:hypothetical protein
VLTVSTHGLRDPVQFHISPLGAGNLAKATKKAAKKGMKKSKKASKKK